MMFKWKPLILFALLFQDGGSICKRVIEAVQGVVLYKAEVREPDRGGFKMGGPRMRGRRAPRAAPQSSSTGVGGNFVI